MRLKPAQRYMMISLLSLSLQPAFANDPITVTEDERGTGTRNLTRDGLIDFITKDLKSDPRDVTIRIFDHPYVFDVTRDGSGQATSVRFTSSELGIDRTFNGTNTSATVDAVEGFLKSEEFLSPFYRQINAGSGGNSFSGAPTGTVSRTATTAFNAVMLQDTLTAEEYADQKQSASFRGIFVGAGFSKFDSNGFEGSSIKVTPGYGWAVGEKKDHRINLNVPIERIMVEGLQSFRVGTLVQFIKPFYLPAGVVWRLAPDVSYSFLGSIDVPSFTGTIGGALVNTFSKDWGRFFGNLGLYYGRFQNLGGISTNLRANVYSYGAQMGRRLGKRWITTAYGIGVSEDVNLSPSKSYQTGGASVIYRIFDRFNLEVSVNRTFGIPGYDNTEASFGSAWNF